MFTLGHIALSHIFSFPEKRTLDDKSDKQKTI